ncbi:MAG: putative addiction module antidote protein [bacterium]|nr:putative addiction module antidote protein [bacterium]
MTKLIEYDGTNFLNNQKDIDAYLAAASESGDSKLIARALGNVMKKQNFSAASRALGLNRAGLYRSFSQDGDPKLSTFLKATNYLGYQMVFVPKVSSAN